MAAAILARRPEANTDLVDLWSLVAFGSRTDVKRHLGVVPHVSKIWPRIDDDDHDRETLMARTLTLFFKRFDQEWWNGELGFLRNYPIFDPPAAWTRQSVERRGRLAKEQRAVESVEDRRVAG
jgi:hypothetical protein